ARAPRPGLAPVGAARGGGVTGARLGRLAAMFGPPVALFALWWFASAGSTSFYLPPLATIVERFGPTWSTRWASDVAPSIVRLVVGYAGAVVLGVGLGVPLGA